MTDHWISVKQLRGQTVDNRHAFLNVINDAFGGIGIWGVSYELPTYLLIDSGHPYRFLFMQFANIECAEEWFADNWQEYEVVWTSVKEEKNG